MDVVENLIQRLLPSPVETTQETGPVLSDYELLAQRLCKIAKEADTEGAASEQYLHDDQNCEKTTITNLPTDFVEIPRPTLLRVSFKAAEEASTDGATNVQCQYDDQNYKKTTITKLPMDSETDAPMSVF